VINDKSQGSITKHLKCDVLLYYEFVIQSGKNLLLDLQRKLYIIKVS